MTGPVIVWDIEDDPSGQSIEVWCWQSYAHGGQVYSIPRYLEDHAEALRAKYLAFIHDLGESRIGGKRIVDHLDMGDGFSFWWMTPLAEKSPFKSPRIYDCLRMMALEEILLDRKPSSLTLHSSSPELSQAVRRLCRNLRIAFAWQRGTPPAQEWSLRRIYRCLPYPVQALISLRHIVTRWPLRMLKRPQWFSGDGAVFLCSYFIHLDLAACAQGRFQSRFWEALPKCLHDNGRRTNWIQHFLFEAVEPGPDTSVGWLRQFNLDADRQGYHRFLDSYLTWRNVARALKNWCWLNVVIWRLRQVRSAFCPVGSAAWLWPFMRRDWFTSLCGPVAMGNCLSIELFDAALKDIPRQRLGLYLFENQGWERALLRAWRKYDHGKIIGVVHSTVPFWHLYYFDDPRSLAPKQTCTMPLPDELAVNGTAARSAFADVGYPLEKLVDVEALRYLKLPQGRQRSAVGGAGVMKPPASESREIRILVLGDMIPASMHRTLSLLDGAVKLLSYRHKLTFKPHPGYAVKLSGYPCLHADETTEALDRILGEYDIAVAANSTSASVDAYAAGLRVIIALDGADLNLSPLRGQSDVLFVSTPEELAEALRTAGHGIATNPDRNYFFFLDPELPRWKRLLASASST